MACVCLLAVGTNAIAQEPAPPPAQATVSVLPSVAELASALADPGLREQALISIAAVANSRREAGGLRTQAELAQQAANDRDWLVGQLQRFGAVIPNSPMLDPAAWRVQLQLLEQGLPNTSLATPLGPGMDTLLSQAFNREDSMLAAVALPELFWYLETQATVAWAGLLDELVLGNVPTEDAEPITDEAQTPTVEITQPASEQVADVLGAGPPPPSPDFWAFLKGTEGQAAIADSIGEKAESATDLADSQFIQTVLADAGMAVGSLASQITRAGPPDPGLLGQVRRQLLAAMPTMQPAEQSQAGHLLHLASLLDGLNEQRYFRFTEGLLALSAQLTLDAADEREQVQPTVALLADILPRVSASYARQFSTVDPRLNTALAVAFDVSRSLAREELQASDWLRLQGELADSVARLALLVPDMGFYFDLPVRDPVAGGVDACAGLAARSESGLADGLSRDLFDDCLQSLVVLADGVARESQLAGDPDGPFGEQQLNRELALTAGQRINYGLGYLYETYGTACGQPEQLPNPLEWAFLATFMTWFAEQSPVFFQTPENEQRLNRMRAIGAELTTVVSEQVDCIAGIGVGVNDPVKRVGERYRAELVTLGERLQAAQQEYRDRYLAAGADVDLGSDVKQSTAYRPAELLIKPCDPDNVCEMSAPLTSTRALVGLFPEPYLLADQTRLGQVQICYDDMGWQQRRSEPVRPDDDNVANFFGQLEFKLRGRFVSRGSTEELFAFKFVSPEEYHYMFAESSPEILGDACPVEWIGKRIVTTMPGGKRSLVPNRLTYLSAPRSQPSRLLDSNWERGAEWRDWFVTGIGVERLPVPPPTDIAPGLSQHLQSLRRLEQEAIYGSLLRRGPANDDEGLTPLFRELNRLGNAKSLLRLQLMLFYPHVLTQSDRLRAAIAGNAGLLDSEVLDRFRQSRVPVPEMLSVARTRLEQFEQEWAAIPEVIRRRGSAGDSVIHAMARLNALQDQFFNIPGNAVTAPAAPVVLPENPARDSQAEDSQPTEEPVNKAPQPEAVGEDEVSEASTADPTEVTKESVKQGDAEFPWDTASADEWSGATMTGEMPSSAEPGEEQDEVQAGAPPGPGDG